MRKLRENLAVDFLHSRENKGKELCRKDRGAFSDRPVEGRGRPGGAALWDDVQF